jgi:hypothetical protein
VQTLIGQLLQKLPSGYQAERLPDATGLVRILQGAYRSKAEPNAAGNAVDGYLFVDSPKKLPKRKCYSQIAFLFPKMEKRLLAFFAK